jgi:hypothetical protein
VNPKKLKPHDAPTEYEAAKALLEYVTDSRVPPLSLDEFRTDRAHGRLILLAMASLGPLAPNGEPIDLAEEFERHGVAAVTDIVPGQRSKPAARGFWPVGAPPMTGHEDPAILKTHGVDDIAASKLASGDQQGFLERRQEILAEVVTNFLGSRLEPDALVRPPLEDLVVADTPGSDE